MRKIPINMLKVSSINWLVGLATSHNQFDFWFLVLLVSFTHSLADVADDWCCGRNNLNFMFGNKLPDLQIARETIVKTMHLTMYGSSGCIRRIITKKTQIVVNTRTAKHFRTLSSNCRQLRTIERSQRTTRFILDLICEFISNTWNALQRLSLQIARQLHPHKHPGREKTDDDENEPERCQQEFVQFRFSIAG